MRLSTKVERGDIYDASQVLTAGNSSVQTSRL